MDLERLNKKIEDSGLKPSFIAKNIGISIQGLWYKRKGGSAFTLEEAKNLSKVLQLTKEEFEEIFLN